MKYFNGYRFWYHRFFNRHLYNDGQPKRITDYFVNVSIPEQGEIILRK